MTRTRPPGGIKNGRIKLYIDRGNFSIYGRTVWVTFSTDEYVIAKRRGEREREKKQKNTGWKVSDFLRTDKMKIEYLARRSRETMI